MQSISSEKVTFTSTQLRELSEIIGGFLNRKQAMMRELDHKTLKKIGNRQLSRLQQVIDREKYASLPDVQYFLGYTEEVSFHGFAPTTLKTTIRMLLTAWNKQSVAKGGEWLYTEAALLAAIDTHVPSLTTLGKGDSNQLFVAFTVNVDAIRVKGQDRPQASLADIRKWSKANVDVISFEEPVKPAPPAPIAMMTAAEAIAKVKETELQLQALKESQAQLQIDAALTPLTSPAMKEAMASARTVQVAQEAQTTNGAVPLNS